MANSGLDAITGALLFLGFIILYLLVVAFMIIQYRNLIGDVRNTPPQMLPPRVLRRSVLLVVTQLVLLSLMHLFPESNGDQWTVTSFLTDLLGAGIILGLILAATIWWEMRRKIVRNRPS